MKTGLVFGSPASIQFSSILKDKTRKFGDSIDTDLDMDEYMIQLESGIFEKPTEIDSQPTMTALGIPGGKVSLSYKIQHWHTFEDSVWRLFAQMNISAANLTPVAIKINENQFFMSNGIFCTDHQIFVCKTLFALKSSNLDQPRNSLINDVENWVKSIPEVGEFLLKNYLECEGKKIIPLVITKGYLLSQRQKKRLKELGVYTFNDRFVDELTNIASRNGNFAMTVMCQELFRGEPLPYDVNPFNALMEEIDGAKVYTFFASAKEIVDTMYVHRRLGDTDEGFAMAYQRLVKPKKVESITKYLTKSGAFFPNSIVVAIEQESFDRIDGNYGKLKLPSIYGNMWIIDGQHRLYGSAFSNDNKPVSICAIQGLPGLYQARHFKEINTNQSQVSSDLIWDLKGELYAGITNPQNKEEEEMYRQCYVSNAWKYVNTSDGPLSGMIHIPSQTPMAPSPKLGHICKLIDEKKIWTEGVLINSENAEATASFAGDLLNSMFEGIREVLPEEWEKKHVRKKGPTKNWVHLSSSMHVICKLFVHGVTYFATSSQYSTSWHSREESNENMLKFGRSIAKAISCDSYGFFAGDKDIRDAGNDSIRNEYVKDMVISMRENDPDLLSPEFAPGIGYEDSTSLDFSPPLKKKIENIELVLRDLCSDALRLEGNSPNFTKYLSNQYQEAIKAGLEQEQNWTDVSVFSERKKLDYLTLSQLQEVFTTKKHYEKFNVIVNKQIFEEQFRYVRLIRNAIAHKRQFPDHQTKRLWTVGAEQVWEWIKQAQISE